jgi:hypothetical protein
MRRRLILLLLIAISYHFSIAQSRFWVASSASNWNNTANWSTTSGGAGGASVPSSGNLAVFNAGSTSNCTLDIAPTVGGITMTGYTGTINLSGNTLTTIGTNTFTNGTITNSGASASLTLNTTLTTTFSGTIIGVAVTGTTGSINFNGSTFSSTVDITKTNNVTDTGDGGNTFNGAITLTHTGTNSWRMGNVNPDVFNSTLSLNVNNTGSFSLARTAAANQFKGNVSIVYNALGDVIFGTNGGTSTLVSPATISVTSGASGPGTLTLSNFTAQTAQTITLSGNDTGTVTLGPASTFSGNLTVTSPSIYLNSSTFQGTTQFTKTGSATNDSRGGNTFNGVLTVNNQGGDFVFGSNGADAGDTWNANATFNNTGGNRIRIGQSNAGNVFNANATFNSGGTTDVNNRIQVSRLTGGQTTFNGTTTFTNNGTASDIHVSYDAGTSTTFNGPVIFNSATTGADFWIGVDGNVTFTSTIEFNSSADEDIYLGEGNGTVTFTNGSFSTTSFSVGRIRLRNFTQTVANALTLVLPSTGTGTLRLGPSTEFNGSVNFEAPQIVLDGVKFDAAATLKKTGATTNTGTGGNIFNGPTILTNSGSGSFEFANTSPETFNSSLVVNNTGSARVQIGISAAGNVFAGPVTINHGGNTSNLNTIIARNAGSTATFSSTLTLNCTNLSTDSGIIIANDGAATINGNVIVSCTAGRGVLFGNSTGSTTLSSGHTINTAGAGTFTTGTLTLKKFTQSGSTDPHSITLSGTADMTIGPGSTFNGAVNFITPQIHLNGCTFNGITYLEKNGASSNTGSGTNTFNGVTTIINSGTGNFILANPSNDLFNNNLTLTNTGSALISIGDNSSGNIIDGNITVNCTSGNGIYFGNNSGASVTMTSPHTITVGGSGFTTGELRLKRFTQSGSTTQTMTFDPSGTGILRIGPVSTFNGNATFSAPGIELDGTTFAGTATLTKTGSANNDNTGGNTFNGTTLLTNSGTGRWRLSATTADNFVGNVSFVRNSGTLQPAYINTNLFSGDINTSSSSTITFGAGGGTVQFTGSNAQSFTKTGGTVSPTVQNLSMSKSSNKLTLSTDVSIAGSATLTTGIISSTSTNYLNFADNATVAAANDLSFVDGVVRKTGNDAFTFPTGTNSFYRPISISAPSATTDQYTAQYFNTGQTLGGSSKWDPSFYTVSGCEYWNLTRTNGTSTVNITLSWNQSVCGGAGYITDPATLRVTGWSGTAWTNLGNGSTTGNSAQGTIISSSAATAYNSFTLATTSGANPLPIELARFWASDVSATVTLNWITSTEYNNNYFNVQRSENGIDFQDIRKIESKGNSWREQHYSFLDESPLPGLSYYRLKQTDLDGASDIFKMVAVTREGSGPEFMVHPNPTSDGIMYFSEKANVSVFNSLNQIVYRNESTDQLDASNLAPGIYLIKTLNGKTARFVKK